MKRLTTAIFITLLLIPCSATELWNGFTDEMTKQQVISRANKLLNAPPKEYNFLAGNDGIELFLNDHEHANHFLRIASVVCYSSPNKEFQRHVLFYADGGNVRFYFIENNLYAVAVEWHPAIAEQVIKKAEETYGNNFRIFDAHRVFTNAKPTVLWDFPDKEVYLNEWCLTIGDEPFPKLYVFSKERMKRGKEIIQQEEYERKRKIEQERQQAANKIAF